MIVRKNIVVTLGVAPVKIHVSIKDLVVVAGVIVLLQKLLANAFVQIHMQSFVQAKSPRRLSRNCG